MTLLEQAFQAILPSEWLKHFEVKTIQEKPKEWRITLIEKAEWIPKELQGKEVVQNGYTRPIEIMDFPLRGKPVYLLFFRRCWKEAGGQTSFVNSYDFHPTGMKATKGFGTFLKGLDRAEADQFFSAWQDYRHLK